METKFKTNNLQPEYSWCNPEYIAESEAKIIRRKFALIKWFIKHFDNRIKAKYSLDDLGSTCIRLFVYIDKEESNTLRLIAWLKNFKDWQREKFWRQEKGSFSYRMQKEKGKFEYGLSYIILFEDTANIDGCVIKEKTVKTKIFVTDCEKERIII